MHSYCSIIDLQIPHLTKIFTISAVFPQLIPTFHIQRNQILDSKMDSSVKLPKKSRLARTFAKVLHVRAAGFSPEDDNTKKDGIKSAELEDDEELMKEAFMAKVFASLSAIKSAYAQLQYAESPYDVDGIQTADRLIVSELKRLSELKQSYSKKEIRDPSPERALLVAEVHELSSVVKTYEITSKKLDSQSKLKESEIIFLKEKLAETGSDCRLLEKRLNSSGQLGLPDHTQLSSLRSSHFVQFLRFAVKSIRSFVRSLIDEMQSEDWDLIAAASSIQPGVKFWKPNHVCFAFESFVSREMFDGFDDSNDSPSEKEELPRRRRRFFNKFTELRSVKSTDYLARKPKSTFAAFCRSKYLRVIHPKMEESFFGDLEQRRLISSGELPESPFFAAFVEMARRVWLLRCLAFSLDPAVSVFRVSEGSRFSEVYMESVSDEAFDHSQDPRVAFTVVPGFKIGKTVVQSQVYIS